MGLRSPIELEGSRVPREADAIDAGIRLGEGCSPHLAQELLQLPALSVIASGRRGRLERIEWQGTPYARKVYLPTSATPIRVLARRLPRRWRWARPHRSWQAMLLGVPLDLPLPRPLVLDTNRSRAVLISSWVAGEPIHHWFARSSQSDWPPRDQFRFARWIGARLQQVTALGFSSRDLAPHNVLVSGDPEGPWQLGIVDLDDAVVGPAPSRRQLSHSLAQVGHLPPTISSTLLMRAMHAFLDEQENEMLGEHRNSIADIAARIHQLQRIKRERQARSGTFDPLAGWGLGEDGLPVPFTGARSGP
ncbi:MAG: phosphotransferase [Planctomycetota bacterium]|nr:phosphotransferase [Planctomycetota bacterium]